MAYQSQMILIVISIVIIAFYLFWLNRTKKKERPATFVEGNNSSSKLEDDYDFLLDTFKEQKSNISEFELFGTKAAIAWNDGDREVFIICIRAFRMQEPITNKWDHFEFDIKEKKWSYGPPKGAETRIREELTNLDLI